MISDKDIAATREKLWEAVHDAIAGYRAGVPAVDALIAFERAEAAVVARAGHLHAGRFVLVSQCLACQSKRAAEAELARIIAESRSSETPDRQAEVEAQ